MQLLRFPIVTFARAAQRAGVPPERMLAIFKRTLTRVRAFQRLQLDEREMIRERLVEMVIGGYYLCVIRRRSRLR
ncbi:MAG TPA: hypothetical protein VFT29_05250 [Gemmatimonadaceae bacterium]|nr:hypothetical protein [Gemmatimonadaceae bacterium]